MAIRAFISTWQFVPDPSGYGGEVRNPITEHLNQRANLDVVASMFYPDADANGLPDKEMVLVLVESPTMTGKEIEALENLSGVTLIPAFRGDKPLVELPTPAKNAIDSLLATHKIPSSVLTGSVTMRDVLMKIAQYISPGHSGVETYFDRRLTEFG